MKTSVALLLPACALVLGCIGSGCQSGPETSSSSNWVICELPVDCSSVALAVDCVDGYCVDAEGERIERTTGGTGGTTSSSGGSGSGGASGGTASASGGTSGSGGEPLNEGGQGGSSSGTGRACGEAVCDPGEICVQSSTVTGPTQNDDFSCFPNPCAGSALDCACAEPACDLLDDGRSRLCSISLGETADILCEDQSQ